MDNRTFSSLSTHVASNAFRQSIHRMAIAGKSMIPRKLCVTRLKKSAGKTVLLTFDDGPHPIATPEVLSRLRYYKARAIFFVVGCRIQRAPEMLAQILSEGHWLGNHSYSHVLHSNTRYYEYLADLERCQDTVFDLTKSLPFFHRPPFGRLTFASLFAPPRNRLSTILWTLSSEDWQLHSETEAASCAESLIAKVKPQDILLLHDEKMLTVATLDKLLPGLQARGFSFSPRLDHIV